MSLFDTNDNPIGPAQPFHWSPSPQRSDQTNFHVYWPGVEGAQGFQDARSQHWSPWPYTVGYKQFLAPGRYGTASTLAAQGAQHNLWSGALAYRPLGYEKPMTGSYTAF